MGNFFAPTHLLIILIVFGLFLAPAIFYVLTLQNALRKCAPESRSAEPGLLWLTLVPIVNWIVNFFVVLGMAKTLRKEFDRRGIIDPDPNPGQSIGLAMCICSCCGIIPIIGVFAALAGFILWIVYWVKMAGYSGMLDGQTQP